MASNDFYVDITIINLKPGTYKISEAFYKDQEWWNLMHFTTGTLFINGNGAVIDDEYHHSFATIESGTTVSIDNLTFKRFYRVFANGGKLYCSNCTFIENDAKYFLTETVGSVIYNKAQATFDNCTFDRNINDYFSSLYDPTLKASIYAEGGSLTNFITCKFTEMDTIHAVDDSIVILYDDNKDNYNLFTNDTRNNFELGSCLDYRPVSSYNANRSSIYNYTDLIQFITDVNNEFHCDNSSSFIINLEKQNYVIDKSQFDSIASPYDFRTFNSKNCPGTMAGEKDDMNVHHRYLLEVGSRPMTINGNGATITLTGNDLNDDNHFAFVPSYSVLTLINLTISGFNTAIVNHGQLILINCTLMDNNIHYKRPHTFEGEKGGAIRNYGSVFGYNSTFINNGATEGGAYYGKGSSTFAQFYNCTFKDNKKLSNDKENNIFIDQLSVVKIVNCTGVKESNIKTDNDALVIYRNTLDTSLLNYKVDNMYSLMKLSELVKNNREYDIINVSFVSGEYGVLPDHTLFDMGYGQLMISGNGARVFVMNPKDDDDAHFLITNAFSSVIVRGLTIEGFNMAIINKGGLSILDSKFADNHVNYVWENDYGGAIVNLVGGSMTVYNTTFINNTAKYGGAIYNRGTAKVIDCIFTNNSAYDDDLPIDIYNHDAGVSIIGVGSSPNVIDNFPMAAWKQKMITATISIAIIVASSFSGFGIAATMGAASYLATVAAGTVIGSIGGAIDALIYSNDQQDYGEFGTKLLQGISLGIQGAFFGSTINRIIAQLDYNDFMKKKQDWESDYKKWITEKREQNGYISDKEGYFSYYKEVYLKNGLPPKYSPIQFQDDYYDDYDFDDGLL